jgi:hypothetical protein
MSCVATLYLAKLSVMDADPFEGLRAWRHGLNFPIYVPPKLKGIRSMLAQGHVAQATSELLRLGELGSAPAAALLDYLCLCGLDASELDVVAISKRCREAAKRGDGFAQYAVGWRHFAEADFANALDWLTRSATQRFVPAMCDSGRFFANGTGLSRARPDVAKTALCQAIRRGHVPSILYFLKYGRQGLFGAWWRVFSSVIYPVAIVLAAPLLYLRPFDIFVFTHVYQDAGPPILRRTGQE